MASNYDSVVSQLTDFGLIIKGIDTGRIVRVYTQDDHREKRGWYSLHEVTGNDGERLLVGSYGVWHGNDANTQKIRIDRKKISAEKLAAIRARMAEDRKRATAARERESARAAASASAAWGSLERSGESEYLTRKGVGAHGLRFSKSGSLAIPMLDTSGNIRGLQFILPKGHPRREKTKREKEYWPRGLAKQGAFFLIGSPRDVLLIAEGYATAATLHEATGLAVAVAFDANNLLPVARALHDQYSWAQIVVCADDDNQQKCRACGHWTAVTTPECQHCGQPHRQKNAGIEAAENAALAVGGKWCIPRFSIERKPKKHTDFNDLHAAEGLHVVRQQIDAFLANNSGPGSRVQARGAIKKGGGGVDPVPTRISIHDGVQRYWGTYGFGGDVLFDEVERRLIHKRDVANLMERHGVDKMREHPDWRIARDTEIGFDPTERDKTIRCNLYSGWKTVPKAGCCDRLLEMLWYLCGNERTKADELYNWVLRWIAYPIQHPGAKMHSAIVVHGPQGTGKSRFFEAVVSIYGEYGRVLGQEALEDKFNADWAEKKLFILADEVLARSEMYHVKNRLKGFITGDTIRVNPKNMPAHTERNHMNIVFLSNERQPIALENDDRRHCVIWVPPKLGDEFYAEVTEEINNGGVAALHQYLLDLDLGDFKPWTHPPMTDAKADLVLLGASSEERFVREWADGHVENPDGETIPICPCVGSSLYRVYERWCHQNGEHRPRNRNQFINYLRKLPGWDAARSHRTQINLTNTAHKNRRMIIPPAALMEQAAARSGDFSAQGDLRKDSNETKTLWLTRCLLEFENFSGLEL